MLQYKNLEKYIANMFVALIGNNATSLGFSSDSTRRCLIERQNRVPMPDVRTILQFRVDNFDYWRSQRYGHSSYYDAQGKEHILELRTCKIIVNVLSKGLGDAFDSARLIVANLQNQRYNDYIEDNGRIFGIENVSKIRNLSVLENGAWTERIQFEITVSYTDEIVNTDNMTFVNKPSSLEDTPNCVQKTLRIEK